MPNCCPNKPSIPGMCRIFVLRGNIQRNRLAGSPGSLPVYVVEHEGKLHHCHGVRTKDPVEFKHAEDPTANPYAWGETTWPVELIYA